MFNQSFDDEQTSINQYLRAEECVLLGICVLTLREQSKKVATPMENCKSTVLIRDTILRNAERMHDLELIQLCQYLEAFQYK